MSDAGGTPCPIDTRLHWFGDRERPLAGWLTLPQGRRGTVGVAIAQPLGYEYWSAHRTNRALAESLGRQGCTVLRFDYDGTGDSAGSDVDPGRVSAWRASIAAAAAELRTLGADSIVLVGIRLGAALCALEAKAVHADSVVLIDPVTSGKRLVRELRLLGAPLPAADGDAIVAAGTFFSQETLAQIRLLDLQQLDVAPAGRVLVVDRSEDPRAAALAGALEALGGGVAYRAVSGLDRVLDVPAGSERVGTEVVAAVADWIGSHPDGAENPPPANGPDAVGLSYGAASITEEGVTLGPSRLVSIISRPHAEPKATVVLLNSGGEPHVGPGRAWVEFGRAFAAAGYTAVRADFGGWGESPGDVLEALHPYDPQTLVDTHEMIRVLRDQGHERIVLLGLCASAWGALHTVLDGGVAGAVAINAQLYWKHGDPAELIIAESRARRAPEVRRYALGARFGLWNLLDVLRFPHPAARWLRRLTRARVPVLLLFADRDDGLVFLEQRTGRALAQATAAGTIEVAEVEGIDHPMHRLWLREHVLGEIIEFLDRRVALASPAVE